MDAAAGNPWAGAACAQGGTAHKSSTNPWSGSVPNGMRPQPCNSQPPPPYGKGKAIDPWQSSPPAVPAPSKGCAWGPVHAQCPWGKPAQHYKGGGKQPQRGGKAGWLEGQAHQGAANLSADKVSTTAVSSRSSSSGSDSTNSHNSGKSRPTTPLQGPVSSTWPCKGNASVSSSAPQPSADWNWPESTTVWPQPGGCSWPTAQTPAPWPSQEGWPHASPASSTAWPEVSQETWPTAASVAWPSFDAGEKSKKGKPKKEKRGATSSRREVASGRNPERTKAAVPPKEAEADADALTLLSIFPDADLSAAKTALFMAGGNRDLAAEILIGELASPPQFRASPSRPPPLPPPSSQPDTCRQRRQRALCVGVNYFGTRAELRGCLNDVRKIQALLTQQYGWPNHCVRTLTDDDPRAMPTRRNILEGLHWLVEDVQPGDALFFHFSGHGAQQEDPHGYEEDGMNETILPVDFQRSGMLSDDEIGDVIVKHLPEGARLTVLLDCCHSGTGLDLPFLHTSRGWKEETNPYFSRADVVLISGCEDDDCSADASDRYGAPAGAMTSALTDVLSNAHELPFSSLMQELHRTLRAKRFTQKPQLTSSQRFGMDRIFNLVDAIPNHNQVEGRVFRKKFPPKPRKFKGPLGLDLMDCGMLAAAGLAMSTMPIGAIGEGLASTAAGGADAMLGMSGSIISGGLQGLESFFGRFP
mmetsp:Transcript_9066/g.20195  ORF Transcript_9066/g.20195 Transcript_9066/m.20195 type:complete len:699 (-) Transcript_9066:2-2098(-)